MAKKCDNETETIEGKILRSLLEGPKTSTQLLEELGYDTNRHGNITKPLKKLEGKHFIGYKSVKSENIDDFCKLWSIIPSHEKFKKMLDDYPSLFSNMHKNELVLNSVLDASECSTTVFDPDQGVPVKCTYSLPEEVRQDLKEKMRLSPEYFRMCFSKNFSQDNAKELTELIEKLESKSTSEENGCFENSSKAQNNIETVFKVCVFYDVLNGQSSEEAKEYLLSEKRKVFEINSMKMISRTTLPK
jgi:hypothetical protein